MHARSLVASWLLAQAALSAGPAPAGDRTGSPARIPPYARPGYLVTISRTWHASDEWRSRRLCLTVENRDHRRAHDAAAWIELRGGNAPQMRYLALHRAPLDPPTLAPGEQGNTCIEIPPEARGLFIRLRARWPEAPAPPLSGADTGTGTGQAPADELIAVPPLP